METFEKKGKIKLAQLLVPAGRVAEMCPRKARNSPFRRHQLEAVAPSWGSGWTGSREGNKDATKVPLCPALGSQVASSAGYLGLLGLL